MSVLRERRQSFGLPQILIDDLAGFQDNYTGKLEQPNTSYGRKASWPILEMWLAALSCSLIVVTDQDAPHGVLRSIYQKPVKKDDPRQMEFEF